MDRSSTFLWMKDLVDHLRSCTDQWQVCPTRHTAGVWADAMSRDLDELRRLCDTLRGECAIGR